MAEDRISISLDFKLSKNYQTIGGQVGFSSDRKEDETKEDHFKRVYKQVDDMLDAVYEDGKKILGVITGK